MITAEEARQRVINLKKKPEVIERVLKKIEQSINDACEKEYSYIMYHIIDPNEASQLNFIMEELEDYGYTVEINKSFWHGCTPWSVSWYEYELIISW